MKNVVFLALMIGLLLTGCKSQPVSNSDHPKPFAEYPAFPFPLNLRMTNPKKAVIWQENPVSGTSADIFAPHIQGEGHAIGRVVGANGGSICVTYFVSGSEGEVWLTTHDRDGELVDKLVMARDAVDGEVGYGGSISPEFRIYRLEMFYVKDERTGKMRPEADHEDVFDIGDDGTFVQGER